MKIYELHLPVFKQGDDLNHSIDRAHGDLAAGFARQAELYEVAAAMCQDMAAVAAKTPGLKIDACTHVINVTGPEQALEELVRDEVLHLVHDCGHDDCDNLN